jgi:hypothetical protein
MRKMITYKIICLNKKEALKLYNMLDKFKQAEYIGDGTIELDGRKVTFKIKYKGGFWVR